MSLPAVWCICGVASTVIPQTLMDADSSSFDTWIVIPGVVGSSPISRPFQDRIAALEAELERMKP